MKSEYRQKFYEKYTQLMPKLSTLEKHRKCIKNSQVFKSIIVNICYIGLFIFTLNSIDKIDLNNIYALVEALEIFLIFGFLYIFVYFGIIRNNNGNKNFSKEIKRICFDDLMSTFDFIAPVPKDKRVEPPINQLFHRYSDNNSTIIPTIDDDFEGSYKNVKFRITEISPLMMRGKLGVYSGPWNGIILKLQFNKSAKTKIFISPQHEKGFIAMLLVGLIFSLIGAFTYPLFFAVSLFWTGCIIFALYYQSKQRINLEDVDFNKKYYVESDNQIEARYILTTAFMERLKSIKTAFDAKTITCMIEGNYVIFAIETKRDMFEFGDVNIPMSDIRQFDRFYNEVTSVCEMIDCLKLDEKTGL